MNPSPMPPPTTPATPRGPEMSTGLKLVLNLLWTIFHPIAYVLWYIGAAIRLVLKLLYVPVGFLLQPVVHFSRFMLALAAVPFQVAARFEALYIYLGVAAIVGLLGGLMVAGIYTLLHDFLHLEAPPEPVKVRTAKEYREQKRKQKIKEEHDSALPARLFSPGPLSPQSLSDSSMRPGNRRNLLTTAILEEEDSDL